MLKLPRIAYITLTSENFSSPERVESTFLHHETITANKHKRKSSIIRNFLNPFFSPSGPYPLISQHRFRRHRPGGKPIFMANTKFLRDGINIPLSFRLSPSNQKKKANSSANTAPGHKNWMRLSGSLRTQGRYMYPRAFFFLLSSSFAVS